MTRKSSSTLPAVKYPVSTRPRGRRTRLGGVVGARGDLNVRVTHDLADRLDPAPQSAPRLLQLAVELRVGEKRRRGLQDLTRSPQLPHLGLKRLDPLRLRGRHPGRLPGVDLGLLHPAPQRLRVIPSCSPIRCSAPALRAGSCLASTASRVARSRNSSGYFFGAAVTLILRELRPSTEPGALQTVLRTVDSL